MVAGSKNEIVTCTIFFHKMFIVLSDHRILSYIAYIQMKKNIWLLCQQQQKKGNA